MGIDRDRDRNGDGDRDGDGDGGMYEQSAQVMASLVGCQTSMYTSGRRGAYLAGATSSLTVLGISGARRLWRPTPAAPRGRSKTMGSHF